jgi:hypothetical protein
MSVSRHGSCGEFSGGPTSRSLGELGCTVKRHLAGPNLQANSPTGSIAAHAPVSGAVAGERWGDPLAEFGEDVGDEEGLVPREFLATSLLAASASRRQRFRPGRRRHPSWNRSPHRGWPLRGLAEALA